MFPKVIPYMVSRPAIDQCLSEPESRQSVTESNNVRILLVEDTLTQAMLFQHMLQKYGFQVKIARSGKQALEQIAQDKPDAVLSDINMPEMSGYDLSRRLKSNDTTRDITVVLLTATLPPNAIFECIKSGADEIALKSMKEEKFVELLKRGLTRRLEVRSQSQPVDVTVKQESGDHELKLQSEALLRLLLSVYELICKIQED